MTKKIKEERGRQKTNGREEQKMEEGLKRKQGHRSKVSRLRSTFAHAHTFVVPDEAVSPKLFNLLKCEASFHEVLVTVLRTNSYLESEDSGELTANFSDLGFSSFWATNTFA